MPAMQWSNERIMEFLELYQTEPCLWDPKEESYKNRGAQNEAWLRINQGLQFPSTVEELKKKKESLMAYYRINLNKYKKSIKSGADASNVYTTSWFAFDLMHSFLKPVYEANNTVSLEFCSTQSRESVSESEASEGQENSCHGASPVTVPIVKLKHQGLPSQVRKRPNHSLLDHHNLEEQHCASAKKQQKDISTSTKQIAASLDGIKPQISNISTHGLDEYDHFALMIAAKIRKINDTYERESVMNTVQNMVFQSLMKNKNNTYQETSKTLQTECWVTSNNESAVEIDTKSNIPLYFVTSEKAINDSSRSPSPGSD